MGRTGCHVSSPWRGIPVWYHYKIENRYYMTSDLNKQVYIYHLLMMLTFPQESTHIPQLAYIFLTITKIWPFGCGVQVEIYIHSVRSPWSMEAKTLTIKTGINDQDRFHSRVSASRKKLPTNSLLSAFQCARFRAFMENGPKVDCFDCMVLRCLIHVFTCYKIHWKWPNSKQNKCDLSYNIKNYWLRYQVTCKTQYLFANLSLRWHIWSNGNVLTGFTLARRNENSNVVVKLSGLRFFF